MGMFSFLGFDPKYFFWAYVAQTFNFFVQGKIYYLD